MKAFRYTAPLLVALTLLVGCRQWEGQLEGPRDVLSRPDVGHVRLTRMNAQTMEVRVAGVQGDSLYGTLGNTGPLACVEPGPLCNVRMSIDQVGFVETREFSLIRTAALVGIPIGAFIVAMVGDEPCRPLSSSGC